MKPVGASRNCPRNRVEGLEGRGEANQAGNTAPPKINGRLTKCPTVASIQLANETGGGRLIQNTPGPGRPAPAITHSGPAHTRPTANACFAHSRAGSSAVVCGQLTCRGGSRGVVKSNDIRPARLRRVRRPSEVWERNPVEGGILRAPAAPRRQRDGELGHAGVSQRVSALKRPVPLNLVRADAHARRPALVLLSAGCPTSCFSLA